MHYEGTKLTDDNFQIIVIIVTSMYVYTFRYAPELNVTFSTKRTPLKGASVNRHVNFIYGPFVGRQSGDFSASGTSV